MTTTPGQGGAPAVTGVPAAAAYLDDRLVARWASAVVSAPRAETMVPVSPLTGGTLFELPVSGPDDVRLAYDGARAVQPSWAHLPAASRAQIVLRFHDLLLEHQATLLDLVQLEAGKARLHAFEELVDVAQVARYYARTAHTTLRQRRRVGVAPGLTQVVEHRRPVGVVGIVAPWNYPLSMGLTDAIPALLAGNAVVLRPDPQTSLTALCALDLLRRAGLPPRVLQVVLGPGPSTGAAVLDEADHACFTGSTPTGREVAARLGRRLVGTSLELGGKNSLYVAADADLDRAVDGAVRASFHSAGQVCVGIERVLVHETVADEFTRRFVDATGRLRLGADLTYDVDLGSLAGADQLARVRRHVDDARSRGARVLTGGRPRPDVGPYFHEPTVLTDVPDDALAWTHETFGPVVCVRRVSGDAEAVRLANDTEYGLHASVWTRDVTRGQGIAAAIRTGTVDVNEGFAASYASTAAPMGGRKASGLGRRHGIEGITRFTEVQTVATQRFVGLGVTPPMTAQGYAKALTLGLKVVRALRLS